MAIALPKDAQKILTSQNIEQKINRMAYQILELHHKDKELVLLGIEDGGFKLAGLLALKIQTIQDIKINLASVLVNKEKPYSEPAQIKDATGELKNKNVILIDDVGNSGTTLFQALQAVYPLEPTTLHVAVLIDRTHKKFPIKADIIGIDLATTLKEHIHVIFDQNGSPEGAYIF